MKIILTFCLGLSWSLLMGQSPIGVWRTIDDNTGEPRSHVSIYEEGDKLFAKITKLLDEDPEEYCTACKGKNANKKILGMVIMEDMAENNGVWSKGTILDPETGNTYKCKIWLDQKNTDLLKVRGIHWTGLYRTQTWHREE